MAAQSLCGNRGVGVFLSKEPQRRLFTSDYSKPSKGRSRNVTTAAAGGRYTQQGQQAPQAFAGDSYLTLGLRPGSSKQDIKSAYRRLALKYHPDVCKGDHCVPKFRQINAAYEALQNILESPNCFVDEDDYWSDEDEEEVKGGWEGAWVF